MFQKNFKFTGAMIALLALVSFTFILSFISSDVSASPIDLTGLPQQIGDNLFDGSKVVGQAFLSAIVIVIVTIPLAYLKIPVVGMIACQLCVLGFLVAIGWLNVWMFIMIALLIAVLLSRNVADWINGGGSSNG